MKKKDVISFFGGNIQTAGALEVTKQAVNGWGDIVPRGIAYEVQVKSKNALKVDPAIYSRMKQRRQRAQA